MLISYLLKDLKFGDLPLALDWVAEHPGSPGFHWHGLRGKIMRRGWEHCNEPAVLVSFAKAAVSQVIQYVGLFNDDDDQSMNLITAPRERRAAVIHAVIKYASEQKIELLPFWGADIRIIGQEDLPWLLTEVIQAGDEFAQREFTKLIRGVFDWRLPKRVDSILSAMSEQ